VTTARAIGATLLSVAAFLLPVILLNRLTVGAARRRRMRRHMNRAPLRSSKADAKRAAHQYAEQVTGKRLSWKSARKLLARWEREGKALGAIAK
jgi:hypothetical protein